MWAAAGPISDDSHMDRGPRILMPNQILVVDDEPDLEALITKPFRKRIRNKELSFQFAGNGEEALTRIQSHGSIDVVLTDINMPVMDGLTLLSRLREAYP